MTQGTNTNRRTPAKAICCHCPECQGREWSLTEIRHACGENGGNPDQQCNGLTLAKIAKLIAHPLRYVTDVPAGRWSPAAPVAREDGTRTPWVRNTDEAAYEPEFYAINGQRIQPALDSGREPGGTR